MKNILVIIFALVSLNTLAASKNPIFKKIEGRYNLTSPDDGLFVSLKIKKNGKVKIKERFIGSGVKSVCKKTKAHINEKNILSLTAECRFRDGYDHIFNKVDKTISFEINMNKVLTTEGEQVDENIKAYESIYMSTNTSGELPVILLQAVK